jgi:transposase
VPINIQPAPKKAGRQSIGRSRGGLSSKIHVVVDGLGNPVRWRLTGGEVHDMTQALGLMKGMQAQSVLADKGYDANEFVSFIREQQMCAVIPPKRNRTGSVSMISRCIKTEIWLNDFLAVSSTLEESPRDMKNWTEISCRLSISCSLIFGWLKC